MHASSLLAESILMLHAVAPDRLSCATSKVLRCWSWRLELSCSQGFSQIVAVMALPREDLPLRRRAMMWCVTQTAFASPIGHFGGGGLALPEVLEMRGMPAPRMLLLLNPSHQLSQRRTFAGRASA